jgi:hypothetical protein
MVLLIREAQVSPEWEFTGQVAAPAFAEQMRHALGQDTPATKSQPVAASRPPEKPEKKRGGFWASLKRAFVGNSEQD